MVDKRTTRQRLPEVEAALSEMLGCAPTNAQIAAVLGVTPCRVYQILHTDPPKHRGMSTAATRAAIVSARESLSAELGREPMMTEVGARAGITCMTVSRAYIALGLDTRAGQREARDQRRSARARAQLAALDGEILGPVQSCTRGSDTDSR